MRVEVQIRLSFGLANSIGGCIKSGSIYRGSPAQSIGCRIKSIELYRERGHDFDSYRCSLLNSLVLRREWMLCSSP